MMVALIIAFTLMSCSVIAQEKHTRQAAVKLDRQIVEASCGMCHFGLKGGCHLAVRIDGKAYPVDGSGLHDHGDPHGAHGLCNVIRKAEVSGKIVKGRFKATSFVLLPEDSEQPEPPQQQHPHGE